jgi:hypothetical protein
VREDIFSGAWTPEIVKGPVTLMDLIMVVQVEESVAEDERTYPTVVSRKAMEDGVDVKEQVAPGGMTTAFSLISIVCDPPVC